MPYTKQISSVVFTLLLAPVAVPRASGAAAPVRPNILFIMADDLGWRDLGCFGSRFHQTPNLDRLAARGVRFTQAYAANPLCSPTRSSVLTGLWPACTGITAPVCHVPRVVLDKQLVKGNPKMRVLVADSIPARACDEATGNSSASTHGTTTPPTGLNSTTCAATPARWRISPRRSPNGPAN